MPGITTMIGGYRLPRMCLLLVAGGIFVQNIDYFHHLFPGIPATIKELLFGIAAGLLAVIAFSGAKKVFSLFKLKAKAVQGE